MKFGTPHIYTMFLNKFLRGWSSHDLSSQNSLNHSMLGVFEIVKQFSGIGLNCPDDKDHWLI